LSVENLDHLSGLTDFFGDHTPDACFFCGKPLAGLAALWYGSGRAIALHPDCGVALGARLIRDALNAHYLAAGKPASIGVHDHRDPERAAK